MFFPEDKGRSFRVPIVSSFRVVGRSVPIVVKCIDFAAFVILAAVAEVDARVSAHVVLHQSFAYMHLTSYPIDSYQKLSWEYQTPEYTLHQVAQVWGSCFYVHGFPEFCTCIKCKACAVSLFLTMGSTTAVEWLHSFPAQLSAATLFAPFDELAAFYKETVVEAGVTEETDTDEGMEFLRFRSGARVAKKRKSGNRADDDDESGFRQKVYMIPAAFPGIIVKGTFLRKLPLIHHCVLVRTGTIFVQNPYKISNLDQTNPAVLSVIAKFEMHNNTYPIYRILRREISVLPLRQMANLVTPTRPSPERAQSPEYSGEFRPFSFVDCR